MPTDAPSPTDDELVARWLAGGGEAALGELFDRARPRLARMLGYRLDARASSRFDQDDVLQESFLEASRRMEDFRALQLPKEEGKEGGEPKAPMPFFLWLRLICQQNATRLHRQHFAAAGRDVRMEAVAPPTFAETSFVLTAALVSDSTSPTAAIARQERAANLRAALDELPPEDRELMVLRHLEGLSNRETAEVLGLTETNASRRNVRLLMKLRDLAKAQKIELTGFLPSNG